MGAQAELDGECVEWCSLLRRGALGCIVRKVQARLRVAVMARTARNARRRQAGRNVNKRRTCVVHFLLVCRLVGLWDLELASCLGLLGMPAFAFASGFCS